VKRRVATVAGLVGLAATPAIAHGDARSVLSAVNAERVSAGIAPVSTRSDWDEACAQHNAYQTTNRILTHNEDSTASLFTPAGSWAASHSILARNSAGFDAVGNPWDTAPLHQFQALHPWLRTTGVDVAKSYACMITLAGRDGGYPDSPQIVTYPGFGQSIPAAEVARESPFVPGDDVGLPQGTKTGPNIMVYALGPQRFQKVDIRNVSLTTADGEGAAVRWVDSTSPKSGPYLDGGAIIIPTLPLHEGQNYTLRVEMAATGADGSITVMSRTTSFAAAAESTARPDDSTGEAAGGSQVSSSSNREDPIAVVGASGGAKLSVALAWNHKGLRVRIHCTSTTLRCEGPLRVLVNRRGHKTQKLRFVARGGPLQVDLAPGRTITRRVKMNRAQRHSGKKRGFSIRWGGPAPVRAKALDYS
jgi:hypothetical protein